MRHCRLGAVRWWTCLLGLAAGFAQSAAIASAAEIKLTAKDGVTVYGDVAEAAGPARGTLLLFHQAGSNRHEYDPMKPRLVALGFRVISIDQRSGGALFGEQNVVPNKSIWPVPGGGVDGEAAIARATALRPDTTK